MTNFYKMVIHLVAKENTTMATSAKEIGEQPLALRLLLACGAIGPLLFIVVFLIHFQSAISVGYRLPTSSW